MKKCDIVCIVPLIEEFRVLSEICAIESTEIQDAIHYHTLKLPDSKLRVTTVVLGEIGKVPASQVTEKALSYLEPQLAVMIGIAGALNKNLRIGDVVVASEVNEFLASSKAVQKDKSFMFQYSGSHWKTTFAIARYVQNFEFTNMNWYDAWRKDVRKCQENLRLSRNQRSLLNTMPRIKIGHIACGDTVVASESYKIELMGIDRKFDVIDLESAGFLQATYGREKPIKTLVIRGVSDFADERKKELDSAGDGLMRRYAMYSTSSFLLHLLRAKNFQDIVLHVPARTRIVKRLPKGKLEPERKMLDRVEQHYACFICYGETDLDFAKRLAKDLKLKGVSSWLYSMDYTPGKRTWKEIAEVRRRADKMIVLCSAQALVRDGVLKEIEEQIDDDPNKIVPISLDNLWKTEGFVVRRGQREDLKIFLLDRNYADFSDESKYEESLNILLRGLEKNSH